MTTLSEFYDALEAHDWYYEMSEDIRVVRAGSANWRRLRETAAELGPEYESLRLAMHSHYYSGPDFGTAKAEKPERPVDQGVS